MAGSDGKRSRAVSKLPVWIIEHVWAHRTVEIQEVVDPCCWPDVDLQPLSLDDTWRLRVASAQVFSIVKNRDVQRFERAIGFLESMYRLLPGLVAPIKHMKLMFGLKTMVIMWMLRVGRGMVDTVCKIITFFPSKLPQYQDQCTQHDMFLMRKNHLDFKTMAQALAMDKDKLKDYIKKHMDEQYGEHYARRVEDRLLHYLHRLETALPGDTYVDKILKKSSPVTEEEKLLLEVVTCDSVTIATTLKKLLHCDVALCDEARVSQPPANRQTEVESSPKALLQPVTDKGKVFRGTKEPGKEVSKDSPHVGGRQQMKEGGDEDSGDKGKEEISQRSTERAPSPQFCSKHHRWVRSILQECPDESSKELQAGLSSSPALFHSSSSTSSSQDLTPSDLIPCPPGQHPPSQGVSRLQTPAQASEQNGFEGEPGSGSVSSTSQEEPLPQLSSPRDVLPPALLSPVVRLVDIAVTTSYATIKPPLPSPRYVTMSNSNELLSPSASQVPALLRCHTSDNKDSTFYQPESVDPPNTSCQPRISQIFPILSTKHTWTRTSTRYSQALDECCHLGERCKKAPASFQTNRPPFINVSVSGCVTHDGSTSTSQWVQSGSLSSLCAANHVPSSSESSKPFVTQNSSTNTAHSQMHSTSCSLVKTVAPAPVVSPASNAEDMAFRRDAEMFSRAWVRSSLPGRAAVLLESTLLQPHVSVSRLSYHECCRITNSRCSAKCVEPVLKGRDDEELWKEEEDHTDSSFDPNTLYTSHSSSSDSEDSIDCDPDYKPCIKKKRLFLEYEAARSLKH